MCANGFVNEDDVVAFLGPLGSNSQDAATGYFGTEVRLLPCANFADIFQEMQLRGCYGIVPIENSAHGSVVQTLDLFREYENVEVFGEFYLPVHHCLASHSLLDAIRTVLSHPQALGQCRRYLQNNLASSVTMEVASTSLGAKMAAADHTLGSICSESAASIYRLPIVAKDIQDDSRNTTRFFAIRPLKLPISPRMNSKPQKTILMLSVPHREPGALCNALELFKQYSLDLTSIQSRPLYAETLWQYLFFIEFAGHFEDVSAKAIISSLRRICLLVRVLGSFEDRRAE